LTHPQLRVCYSTLMASDRAPLLGYRSASLAGNNNTCPCIISCHILRGVPSPNRFIPVSDFDAFLFSEAGHHWPVTVGPGHPSVLFALTSHAALTRGDPLDHRRDACLSVRDRTPLTVIRGSGNGTNPRCTWCDDESNPRMQTIRPLVRECVQENGISHEWRSL
jgi:hypothetical protein